MPDFEAPVANGTAADNAVAYILKRVKRDANFRHYMLGTEALRLCLVADAERHGLPTDGISSISNAPPAQTEDKPDILELRKQMDNIDSLVFDAYQKGEIEDDVYTAIRMISNR